MGWEIGWGPGSSGRALAHRMKSSVCMPQHSPACPTEVVDSSSNPRRSPVAAGSSPLPRSPRLHSAVAPGAIPAPSLRRCAPRQRPAASARRCGASTGPQPSGNLERFEPTPIKQPPKPFSSAADRAAASAGRGARSATGRRGDLKVRGQAQGRPRRCREPQKTRETRTRPAGQGSHPPAAEGGPKDSLQAGQGKSPRAVAARAASTCSKVSSRMKRFESSSPCAA